MNLWPSFLVDFFLLLFFLPWQSWRTNTGAHLLCLIRPPLRTVWARRGLWLIGISDTPVFCCSCWGEVTLHTSILRLRNWQIQKVSCRVRARRRQFWCANLQRCLACILVEKNWGVPLFFIQFNTNRLISQLNISSSITSDPESVSGTQSLVMHAFFLHSRRKLNLCGGLMSQIIFEGVLWWEVHFIYPCTKIKSFPLLAIKTLNYWLIP